TSNTYNGTQWWGTATFSNNGPATSSNYSVAFDVPAGAHCTNDAVPAHATLSPLNGSGTGAKTVSNHCVFTWSKAPLASGASLTFNYSADTTASFNATGSTAVHDAICSP